MENNNLNIIIFIFLIVVSVILFLSLLLSFKSNKVRLLNGMILTSLLVIDVGAISIGLIILDNKFLLQLWMILIGVIILILTIIQIFLGLLLLTNAFIVWKKETHNISNLLTLFLGIYVILSPLLFHLSDLYLPKWLAQGIKSITIAIITYLIFWMICFTMSYILYKVVQPKFNKEYIIVLGAGLINGSQITPLLKSRIDNAIQFGEKQHKKTNKFPILIMSGGQGKDELIAESQAMKEYAIEKNYSKNLILTEEKSRNTYENMLFSKKIVEYLNIDIELGLFSTSDYHVFRGVGYARKAGLPIDGIGSPTKRYFFYNAFLREYIAILFTHKKFHIVCLLLLIFVNILLSILYGYSTDWI